MQDGQVHYFSRHHDLLKRAAIQVASQTAYGLLRSYPRYLKYWEQQVRDKYLQTQSQSSLANKTGQYYQLIREQQAVAQKKNHIDSIVSTGQWRIFWNCPYQRRGSIMTTASARFCRTAGMDW
ncbi:hypothetical protein NXX23_17900 [Bacteroides ovatus]|nr:hypothetical protein [Bacteroides ovatus]